MDRLRRWWSRTGTTGRLLAAAVLLLPLAMRQPARIVAVSYAVTAGVMFVLRLARGPIVEHHRHSIRVIYSLSVTLFATYLALRVFTRLPVRGPAYWVALVVGTVYLGVDFLILSDSRVTIEGSPPPLPPSRRADETVH